ncbi:helix-turn-helix domain-containing protein [Streptacidiphilus jiangxiensis]|uniref:Helix-turn-helix domain-containing protein n=1 Tax=Streptacidiphilus jiangxiensis TaxID=235985 RepID=A0A1H7RC36_STRJI|nr:transcriptional regulator [Streptacidiphilus jiangxiensis]SEL57781.1 Helix-turn-helix domain-containing protein [Streptacidiphilus jiangxiensis]
MVLLRLDSLALARSRFALSPAAETFGALKALSRPCLDPWLADWHARHHGALRALLAADPFAEGLVRLMSSTKYLPDHVTLPPTGGMRTRLDDELAQMRAVPDDEVAASLKLALEASWEEHDLDAWLTGRNFAARTADLYRRTWDAHLAADWPRRRTLLERDVTYRAGLLAAYGWSRALERMARRTAWIGADAIRFSDRPGPDRVVGPEGMLFVPYTGSRGSWLCEAEDRPYALVYPARGSGAQSTAAADGRERALARLLGAGRATILRALARPATSSELAAELDLSLGTVGGHLAILREAELVVGARVGRRVVYRRTEAGEVLATGSTGVRHDDGDVANDHGDRQNGGGNA